MVHKLIRFSLVVLRHFRIDRTQNQDLKLKLNMQFMTYLFLIVLIFLPIRIFKYLDIFENINQGTIRSYLNS
jgi:hypothetical protein